jgi:hypothetical protein
MQTDDGKMKFAKEKIRHGREEGFYHFKESNNALQL